MTLALHGKTKSRQRLLIGFGLLAVLVAAAFALTMQSAQAYHPVSDEGVAPTPFAGNITTCTAISADFSASTGSTPLNGSVWNIGPGTVTVTINDADPDHLSFVSTIPIIGVYIKAGNGGNFYDYRSDPVFADGNLWGSENDNDETQNVSHAVFCANKLSSSTSTTLHLDSTHAEVTVGSSVPFGTSLHDLATVVGVPAGSPTPTGTVTFQFFGNDTCTGTPISTSGAIALDGSGVAHPSQSTGALAAGEYGFLATYSGSTLYRGSTADCENFRVRDNPSAVITVEKTAEGLYDLQCTWDIDKSVIPDELNMFTGDSGEVEYTVDVDLVDCLTEVNYRISGTITIFNDDLATGSLPVEAVTDELGGTIDCGVTLPYDLEPGASLECTYEIDPATGDETTNTATATVDGVDVDSEAATVGWEASGTVIDEEVDVTDTVRGVLGSLGGDGSFTYTRTFTCDADEGEHDNTATFTTNDTDTEGSDDATVTVNCYEITVTKTADTSLTRTWTWDIDKVGDQTALTLSPGQSFLVNYDVTVSATPADSNWAVAGGIAVYNPAPMAATINSVNDVVSPAVAATVNCGVSFPYSLASLGTLNCTYTAALPDATARTNTATATRQNYDENGDPDGTTDVSGTASVSFAAAVVTEIDECIDVTDDQHGDLGTLCAANAPYTFEYSMNVGPYAVCGTYTFTNVASFVTNDTESEGSDDHVVNVTVPCDGCTLTPGYWKTHSLLGPAPYDDAWALVGGANAIFDAGLSYHTVLWTAPQGNVYYILAHAYIAAKLNILDGAATTPAVDAAMTYAATFFASYDPSTAPTKGALRAAAIAAATTLDNYNNGLIGPGHCSE